MVLFWKRKNSQFKKKWGWIE